MSKAAAILVTELTVDDNRKVQRQTVAVPTGAITAIKRSYLIIEPTSAAYPDGTQEECTQIISPYSIWDVAESPRRIAQLMNEESIDFDAVVKALSDIEEGIARLAVKVGGN